MTAISVGERPGRSGPVVKRRFYLVMALLIAAIIIGGFSRTFPAAVAHGLPLLLHIHAAVFASWILLFVAQPAIAANGSLALHRRLGFVGASLAVAMVIMGVVATVLAVRLDLVPSFFPPALFVTGNFMILIVFAGLVIAGVALRGQAEWHKRLLLCASVALLGPGLGRLAIGGPLPPPLVITVVQSAFALAGPVADLIKLRRVHPAYLWGAGALIGMLILQPVVSFSPLGAWVLKAVS
jgi:hypothetical protein